MLINLILSEEFDSVADMNSDGDINVFDSKYAQKRCI